MNVLFDWSRKTERHNLILNTFEGALYASGVAFISNQTVIPAVVARLGGTNVEVGAITVIVYFALYLPQLFAARYVETLPWKKPWAVNVGTMQRSVVLLIAVAIFFLGASAPRAALVCFFILFTLNQTLTGVTSPGWFDLFAKLTPLKKRGRLAGLRTSLGGAGAFLCGLVLTWLLASTRFPTSYSLAFLCAFILQISSVVVQKNLKEEEPSRVVPRRPMFAFLKELPSVLAGHKEFRNFIIGCALLVMGTMPSGFFVVHALKQFHADESIVGMFTLCMVAVQVVSALVTGVIADRYGNKTVLVSAAAAMTCASIVALFAPSPGWYMVVFLFLGIYVGAELMARYNLAIEFGTPERRSLHVGLMNTVLAPFYLSSLLGGFLSDAFGYKNMFGVGIAFSAAGVVFLLLKVREPRLLGVTGTAEKGVPRSDHIV